MRGWVNARRRRHLEPPATSGSDFRSMVPRDPSAVGEPKIELSDRQLELLTRGKTRDGSPRKMDPPSQQQQTFVTRDNLVTIPTATPTRTPNPVSRVYRGNGSESSNASSDREHLRKILQKVGQQKQQQSSSSNTNSTDSQKALLRKILAKPLPSTRTARVADPKVNQFRERLRRVTSAETKAKAKHEPERLSPDKKGADERREKVKISVREATEPEVLQELKIQPTIQATSTYLEKANSKAESSYQRNQAKQKSPSQHKTNFIRAKYDQSKREKQWQTEKNKDGAPPAKEVTALPLSKQVELAAQNAAEDDDLQGYSEFVRTLQTEVSGQHSMLWKSFSAILQNQSAPELNPESIPPTNAFKFDPITKEKLVLMNNYLKRRAMVECAANSQLINDRKWAKEINEGVASSSVLSAQTTDRYTPEPQTQSSMTRVNFCSQSDSSSSQTTLDRYAKLSQSLDIEENRSMESDPIVTSRSSGDSTVDSIRKHRGMRSLTDVLSASSDLDSCVEDKKAAPSDTGTSNFEAYSNPGLEVTLNQFVTKSIKQQPSKYDASQSSESASSSKSSNVPWDNLQLKAVSSHGEDDSTPSSASLEWMKLKLRKVPRKRLETPKDDLSTTSSSVDILRASIRDNDEGQETSENLTVGDDNRNDVDVTSGFIGAKADKCNSESEKDRHASKAQKSTKIVESATIIPLKQRSSSSQVCRIVVGSKILMLVEAASTETQKADVVWKIPRTSIRSFTLDMAAFQVDLLLVDDEKKRSLCFQDSDDCLKFANAFHRMDDIPREGTPDFPIDVEAEINRQKLEALNDEEQTLLETYRRLRQNKPAEDAFHETISQESVSKRDTLTPVQAQIAERYRKMIAHSVPIAAVKHKMRLDDVDPMIFRVVASEAEGSPPTYVETNGLPSSPVSTFSASVTAFSDHDVEASEIISSKPSSRTNSSELSEEDERLASKFRTMLKLRIPRAAVRHKMRMEQIDEKIVTAVLGISDDADQPEVEKVTETVKETSTRNEAQVHGKRASQSDGLTPEEEQIATKYRMMLKMMVPKEAVRHSMIKDGISPPLIDKLVGKDEPQTVNAKEISETSQSFLGTKLSDEEESVASQYRKLLKLQVPKDALVSRMKKEGISEKIIVSVVGNDAIHAKQRERTKDQMSTGSKLVSLHWTPLSGKELDNSVWKAGKKRKNHPPQPESSDISKLIELFQKKKTSGAQKTKHPVAENTHEKAKLLDLSRSNNVAISLKAFKDFSHQELSEIIAFLDPTRKIRGERVQFIRDILPTAAERKMVKDYDGPDDRLVPAELWFRKIVGIPRIETKIKVMRTMEMFRTEASSLRQSFVLLERVCQQVMDSTKLQDLLEMVLQIGNIMNEGTRTGGAAGFKFDSLLRLTQTKSSDGKTTVLDYLVTVFVAKGERAALDLLSDFPDCQQASRMLINDMLSDVKGMEQALDLCKSELKELRSEASVGGETDVLRQKSMKISSTTSTTSDSRVELMAAILSRGSRVRDRDATSDVGINSLNPSSESLVNADEEESDVTSRGGHVIQGQCDESDASWHPNNLKGGIRRLADFLSAGEVIFSDLQIERDKALEASRELAKYCGESGGAGATTSILGILSEFASSIDVALKKFDQQKEATDRQQKKKPSNEESTVSVESPSETLPDGKSLVMMVNDLLRNANEQTKVDFRKGRVYPNPSERLKAIYDCESKRTVMPFTENSSLQENIVNAIRERECHIGTGTINAAKLDIAGTTKERKASLTKFQQMEGQLSAPGVSSPNTNTVALNGDGKTKMNAHDQVKPTGSKAAVAELLELRLSSSKVVDRQARTKPYRPVPERTRYRTEVSTAPVNTDCQTRLKPEESPVKSTEQKSKSLLRHPVDLGVSPSESVKSSNFAVSGVQESVDIHSNASFDKPLQNDQLANSESSDYRNSLSQVFVCPSRDESELVSTHSPPTENDFKCGDGIAVVGVNKSCETQPKMKAVKNFTPTLRLDGFDRNIESRASRSLCPEQQIERYECAETVVAADKPDTCLTQHNGFHSDELIGEPVRPPAAALESRGVDDFSKNEVGRYPDNLGVTALRAEFKAENDDSTPLAAHEFPLAPDTSQPTKGLGSQSKSTDAELTCLNVSASAERLRARGFALPNTLTQRAENNSTSRIPITKGNIYPTPNPFEIENKVSSSDESAHEGRETVVNVHSSGNSVHTPTKHMSAGPSDRTPPRSAESSRKINLREKAREKRNMRVDSFGRDSTDISSSGRKSTNSTLAQKFKDSGSLELLSKPMERSNENENPDSLDTPHNAQIGKKTQKPSGLNDPSPSKNESSVLKLARQRRNERRYSGNAY